MIPDRDVAHSSCRLLLHAARGAVITVESTPGRARNSAAMQTAHARPSTRALAEFFAGISADTDAAIKEAAAYILTMKSVYATQAAASRVRRLARECIYVATTARQDAAHEAWMRLSAALTSATDHDGAHHEKLRVLYHAIMEPRAKDRADFIATNLRRAGDLSHLSPLEQAYRRELRAMWRQHA